MNIEQLKFIYILLESEITMYQERGLVKRFGDYGLVHSQKLLKELKGPIFLDEGFINSGLYEKLLELQGSSYLRRFQLYSPSFLPDSGSQEYLSQTGAFSKASKVATCFVSSIENLEELVEERSKGRSTIFPTIIFGSRAQQFYNLQREEDRRKRKGNNGGRLRNCGPRNLGYVVPDSQGLRIN